VASVRTRATTAARLAAMVRSVCAKASDNGTSCIAPRSPSASGRYPGSGSGRRPRSVIAITRHRAGAAGRARGLDGRVPLLPVDPDGRARVVLLDLVVGREPSPSSACERWLHRRPRRVASGELASWARRQAASCVPTRPLPPHPVSRSWPRSGRWLCRVNLARSREGGRTAVASRWHRYRALNYRSHCFTIDAPDRVPRRTSGAEPADSVAMKTGCPPPRDGSRWTTESAGRRRPKELRRAARWNAR
jgi:hypothetical protein